MYTRWVDVTKYLVLEANKLTSQIEQDSRTPVKDAYSKRKFSVKKTFKKPQFRWHLQKINAELMDANKGRRKKLYLGLLLVR